MLGLKYRYRSDHRRFVHSNFWVSCLFPMSRFEFRICDDEWFPSSRNAISQCIPNGHTLRMETFMAPLRSFPLHSWFACSITIGATLACVPHTPAEEPLEVRAARIHQQVLTVDTHVDTPMRMVGGKFDIGQRHDRRQRGGRVDLPRMKEGGLDAIFFAVYMGQGPRTPDGHEQAKNRALRIFEAIHDSVTEKQLAGGTGAHAWRRLSPAGGRQAGDLRRHGKWLSDRQ